MMVGIPSTIVLGVLSFLVLRFIVRPDVSKFVNYDPEQRAAKMSRKLSVGERNSVIIFCFVVLAILFPDITKGFWPEASAFVSALTINTVSYTHLAGRLRAPV